jgi:hypothetical protein
VTQGLRLGGQLGANARSFSILHPVRDPPLFPFLSPLFLLSVSCSPLLCRLCCIGLACAHLELEPFPPPRPGNPSARCTSVLLGNNPLGLEPHTSIRTIRVPSVALCPPLLSPRVVTTWREGECKLNFDCTCQTLPHTHSNRPALESNSTRSKFLKTPRALPLFFYFIPESIASSCPEFPCMLFPPRCRSRYSILISDGGSKCPPVNSRPVWSQASRPPR